MQNINIVYSRFKTFIVALLLTMTSVLAYPSVSVLATSTSDGPSISTSINPSYSLPARSDFEHALSEIIAFPNYQTYYNTDPTTLDQLTPFSKEYQYLFNLANASTALLVDYDAADPREATILLAAMRDAVIACNLRFGIQAQKYQASQNSTSSNSPVSSPDTTQPTSPSSTSPKTQSSSTISFAVSSNSPTTDSTSDTNSASTDLNPTDSLNTPENTVDIPATGTISETQTPNLRFLPYLIAAACAIAAIISVFAISSHRRPYRPGRKIR